jgi:hypothetical protein
MSATIAVPVTERTHLRALGHYPTRLNSVLGAVADFGDGLVLTRLTIHGRNRSGTA